MRFQKINNITGWVAFGIALLVYYLTFEETASYWDCGEFIAVSYKLEVSHPPGAPLFMLLGRLFSFLSFGDVTKVAYWINFLSVLSSAFTILFLFWSITIFGRKVLGIKNNVEPDTEKTWLIMGAGLVGALAYTFSESFWFSAVEAEVYAMSSFFTAFVVWSVLKWDAIDDESAANRWLILVAYMMGLSIGVHLLNLVAIPALGLIYYFKKYEPGKWGILATLIISGAIVLFVNDFIVPGLPTLAASFELFFVNNLGLPFGSGVIAFCLLLIGALAYGIRYSHQKNKPILNTFLIATSFILIGYSSYATIVIRSNFDPPINENAPKDVMSFVRYLKREQYGSRPLLYGPYFTSQLIAAEPGAPVYTKGKDKYEISDRKVTYTYDYETIIPRAWNSEHKDTYEQIIGLKEGKRPTFSQNLYFMFKHQIGTMYMRYFMWNFAGRESDEQGANWLAPSHWFDKLPTLLANNGGRNNFFMIPFVLGLIGMFFQFTRDTKNFAVVAFLFIMLGVAIVVYLNSPPVEPRERDYIYAGSTYAFTFWIGLSVIAVAETFNRIFKNVKTSAIAATLLCLTAPAIMAQQGWDDHNRSDRYFSVDSGKNYLDSCAPNSILFTGGDNDTFMLWYLQEVEGYRTDVRVVVLSYFNTDWYIDQSTKKTYESEPLPYTLSLKQYQQGGPNDYLPYANLKLNSIDARQYLGLLSKDYQQLRSDGRNIIPSKIVTLDIDKKDMSARGLIPKGMDSLAVDQMQFSLLRNALEKKDLALLDLIVTNNWERPIYFNNTSLSQINLDMRDYAIQEGNAYRLLPIKNPNPNKEFVNTEVSYNNMINKFHYRGLDDPSLYFTEDYKGFVLNHRSALNSLAEALLDQYDAEKNSRTEVITTEGSAEDKLEKARKTLLFSLEKIPGSVIPLSFTGVTTVELLFRAGLKEKALEVTNMLGTEANDVATYLISTNSGLTREVRVNVFILGELQRIMYENGENELGKKFEEQYEKHVSNLGIQGN
jgi:MFS family permease